MPLAQSVFKPILRTTSTSPMSDTSTAVTRTVLSLYKLGWPAATISKFLSTYLDKSLAQTSMQVKYFLESTKAEHMSFSDLLSIMPIEKFVHSKYIQEFLDAANQVSAQASSPTIQRGKLSHIDVHIINILAMLSWKKIRIAELFNVSPTLVSMYTKDLQPWEYAEIVELFPVLFKNTITVSSKKQQSN